MTLFYIHNIGIEYSIMILEKIFVKVYECFIFLEHNVSNIFEFHFIISKLENAELEFYTQSCI
jgi:hypothetical protein